MERFGEKSFSAALLFLWLGRISTAFDITAAITARGRAREIQISPFIRTF
jgi:hypothetical protein